MKNDPPTMFRFLFFGTSDFEKHPRALTIANGLMKLGHDVAFCVEPFRLTTADRVDGLRSIKGFLKCALTLIMIYRTLLSKALRFRGKDFDFVVVGYLGVLDVLVARLLFGNKVIFDNLAPLEGIIVDRGLRFRLAGRLLDRMAMRVSLTTIWDTRENLERFQTGRNHLVLPVGSPDKWFVSRNRMQNDSHVQIIFFGLFTPLHGTSTIGEAIELVSQPDLIEFHIVGNGQEFATFKERHGHSKNVIFHEWLEPEQLVQLVSSCDIALGIFGTTVKAQEVVPNKVYQASAAGCAVITSDTEPQRAVFGNSLTYVPAGDSKQLALAIDYLSTNKTQRTEKARASRHICQTKYDSIGVASRLVAFLVNNMSNE